jgi:subtilisin
VAARVGLGSASAAPRTAYTQNRILIFLAKCVSVGVVSTRLGLAVLLFIFVSPVHAAATTAKASSTARYVIVLNDRAGDPATVAVEHGSRYGLQVGHVYRAALRGYSAVVPNQNLDRLKNDPAVAFVEPDKPAEALARPSAPPQTLPTGVDRIDGDLSSTRSGDGSGSVSVPIAIIDTGSGPHADLNVVGGTSCVGGNSRDGNGHGTHVAGIAAARDDGSGVVGVAPGAPIYSVRVLKSNGSGTLSTVICGIDWVTANATSTGIKVANMSLRFQNSTDDGNCGHTNGDALHVAICNSVAKGITYVVGAGNESNDFSTNVPAAYDEVLTVTAIADFDGRPGGAAAPTCRADVDDTSADFSSFAVSSADIAHTVAAPGVCIYSTWPGNSYATLSGTSMASPHVAGLVSLCLSSGRCSGPPAEIIQQVRSAASLHSTLVPSYGFAGDPNSPVFGAYFGHLAYAAGF